MPAINPRVSITIEPDHLDIYRRLSAVQHRPVGAIIREVLESARPAMAEVADMMEQMSRAQEAAKSDVLASLTSAHDELAPRLETILGHLRGISGVASEIAAMADEDGPLEDEPARSGSEDRKRHPAAHPH